MLDFHGRVGVVTGAGTGIGRATSLCLVAAGATVVGIGRRAAPLEEVARTAAGKAGKFVVHAADITDERRLQDAFGRADKEFGSISFVFNNAGTGGAHKSIVETPVAEFDRTMSVHVRATFMAMKYGLLAIRRVGGGAIVNCGSVASLKGVAERGDYVVAKHAILALTRTAALEHARENIQINCICPGPIDTPLQQESEAIADPFSPAAERQRLEALIPMRRYGTPAEVAELVAFLLSGRVPYLTGTAIPIDGGLFAG